MRSMRSAIVKNSALCSKALNTRAFMITLSARYQGKKVFSSLRKSSNASVDLINGSAVAGLYHGEPLVVQQDDPAPSNVNQVPIVGPINQVAPSQNNNQAVPENSRNIVVNPDDERPIVRPSRLR